jgi:HK97 gp10 family phage protein
MAVVASRTVVDLSGLESVASAAKTRGMALKAVKAGAKLIVAAAKARAPRRKRSGALKQSLGIKPAKGTRGKTAAYAVIGPRKKTVKFVPVGRGGRTVKAVPAFYAHLVEGGTKPHALAKGSRLARGKRSAVVKSGAGGRHPGARAKPFLRPAFDSTVERAIAAAEAALAAELAKVLAKAKPKRPGR